MVIEQLVFWGMVCYFWVMALLWGRVGQEWVVLGPGDSWSQVRAGAPDGEGNAFLLHTALWMPFLDKQQSDPHQAVFQKESEVQSPEFWVAGLYLGLKCLT